MPPKVTVETWLTDQEPISTSNTHIVDQYHFINVILEFISLCKHPRFSDEEEYRVVLIARNDNADQSELEVSDRERKRTYIKLRIPTEFKLRS